MQTGASCSESQPKRVLVIGYGRPQHGDDGIGARVVSLVQGLGFAQVTAESVAQLQPELSGKLAAADCVIFVDACRMEAQSGVRVRPLNACGSETSGSAVPGSGHGCDPCSLLALTQSVYGRCPQAWWVEVPAQHFAAGQALSETAEWGVNQALQEIEALIQSQSR